MEDELMDRVAGHVLVACEDIEHIADVQMYPRLKVATQMAAALVPHALVSHWSPHMLAQHAVALADALIEVCDEPAKPE